MKRYIVLTTISLFCLAGNCQNRERIYLHTDKQCYVAGETIWFKAYLLLQFAPDDEVSNLYIDFLDIRGNILQSKRMPLFLGTAVGNIDIESSTVRGVYFLRAYTKFGFATENISLKPIYLFNPYSQEAIIDPSQSSNSCQFFFQTDHLIAGLTNTVYFKATGIYNTAISITGSILDENKRTVLVFNDKNNGTGKLQWIPTAGEKYSATINFPNGKTTSYTLPPVNSEGVVILLDNSEEYISFRIFQQGDIYKKQKLTLIGIMGEQVAFKQEFTFTNHEYDGKISVAELPEGILHIKVLNVDSVVAETKAFIQRIDNSGLKLKKEINKDGDNDFSLVFPDSVSGSFSISVTDYDKEIIPIHNNIFTELLINHEDSKKTTVLSSDDVYDKKLTETVINTIFSRSELLKEMEKQIGLMPADSNYLSLKGKLIDAKTKKPVTKEGLIIFFKGKDSSSAILEPLILSDGSFSIRDLIFYDTATFYYEWKGKRPVEVVLDKESQEDLKGRLIPTFFDISVFNSDANINKAQNIYKQITDTFGSKTLPSVTVRARYSTLKEQVNKKYATGLFSSSAMARILDLINEPPKNNGINIFDYLQGKFGDLIISRISAGQYSLTSARRTSISGSASIKLFLNQTEVSTDVILSTPLNEVAMIKYYLPGNAQLPGIGTAGVLAVYTKKIEDMSVSSQNFFNHSFKIPGYSPIKDFSEEIQINGKTNISTIYWNPQVIIDGSNNNYSFKIGDANSTKRFHIVVEGFTFEGNILFLDTIIEK